MKLGIISDIHGNLYGLERALEAMTDVDEVLCLGDSIYESKFSNEVIGLLKKRGAMVILGNHEEVFLSEAGHRAREAQGVDRDLVAWLASQPVRREIETGGKKVLMIHSTPWEPRGEYIYPHNSRLEAFGDVDADFVLYGHTHAQVIRPVGRVLVINPGSAGEARFGGNDWQLSCAILDTAAQEVEMVNFPDPRFA